MCVWVCVECVCEWVHGVCVAISSQKTYLTGLHFFCSISCACVR